MINAEFYKEKLLKLAEDNKKIALNINGELAYCGEIDCKQCKWNIPTTSECESLKIEWLLAEHKEYPVLTKFQYEMFTRFANDYNWIAKNSTDEVFLYSGNIKPYKTEQRGHWNYDDGRAHYLIKCLDDFDFIKWTDKKPWSIKELLENCEVEE